MKKRLLAFVVTLCLMVGLAPLSFAYDTLSETDALNIVNGSVWMNDDLKTRFTQVFSTYAPDSDGYQSGQTMSYSLGTAQNCAFLALYTYGELFGYYYGRAGANNSDLKLQGYTNVSYDTFVSEGIYPGAHIRTGTSYIGSNGHSMILLDYDEQYIYVYDAARQPKNGWVGIKALRFTWDGFNSEIARHSKIDHISVPKDYAEKWLASAVPSAGSTTPTISTLAITPTSEPSEGMTPGAAFYFRGKITSNYNITSATVSVLSDSGQTVQTRTVKPNKKSVDILNDGLDSLKFGQLPVGTYTLLLTATDSSGNTEEWSKDFSIGSVKSTLSIDPTTFPDAEHTLGSPFYFRGDITSNYNIKSVTVSVLSENGQAVQTRTVTPNKKTVDILNDGLDSLKFGQLPVGAYNLELVAEDTGGGWARWRFAFSVVSGTQEPVSTPAPIPTPTPAAPAPAPTVPTEEPPQQTEGSSVIVVTEGQGGSASLDLEPYTPPEVKDSDYKPITLSLPNQKIDLTFEKAVLIDRDMPFLNMVDEETYFVRPSTFVVAKPGSLVTVRDREGKQTSVPVSVYFSYDGEGTGYERIYDYLPIQWYLSGGAVDTLFRDNKGDRVYNRFLSLGADYYLELGPDVTEAQPTVSVMSGTAYASTQTVLVDGTPVEFECYALKDAKGYPTNYIKLRDLAYILNGTAAQFEVGWNGKTSTISLTTGQAYTANGSEMSTPFSGDRSYTASSAQTTVNGQTVQLEAITLTNDRGGAYTYYKLRDLGAALGFTVDWSAQKGIFIETK